MGQSGSSWFILVCYTPQDGGTVLGQCNLMQGDGTTPPVVYPAGTTTPGGTTPSGNHFVFSNSNTAAVSLAMFNSTCGIVCYSSKQSFATEDGACSLLTRTETTLSSNTALTNFPDEPLDNVKSSSVTSFSTGANGEPSAVACFEQHDAGNVSCFPVQHWVSTHYATDLVSGAATLCLM